MSRHKSECEVAIPWVSVKFGSFKVLSNQCGAIRLSFQSIWINLDVKYEFSLGTYYCNSWTSLALQNGQSAFIDNGSTQFSTFWLCWFVPLFDVSFANKCFPIEAVRCSDGWRRTWWQTLHMITALPISSIPQWTYYGHEDACLESFQVIARFEHTFIEAHHAWKTICKVRSLKS